MRMTGVLAAALALATSGVALANETEEPGMQPASWVVASQHAPAAGLLTVQYYTPPAPYAYHKYYAYKNNTGRVTKRPHKGRERRHHR